MLHFSFSTILMTLLASSLLVGLIAFVFLHQNAMVCVGYKLLAVFVGLTVIRICFPFEFPFTVNVYFSPMISKIISYFQKPQIEILNTSISIWNLFEIIWIIGIIINLIRYISQYQYTKNFILKYGIEQTEDISYKAILNNICLKHNRKNVFHVIKLPKINIPIIFGLKEPYIILPADILIPADKLYYVLYHEALHYFCHDSFIKGIIRILSIIYWWNPIFIILYKQVNTLLDMRIDKIITHNKAEVISQYTECLLFIKKNSIKYLSQTSAFLKKNSCYFIQEAQEEDLQRRFYMLLQDYTTPKKVFTSIILSVAMIGVYFSSYLFILEANFHRTQFVEESLFIPDKYNTYFIQNNDNNYEFYINGVYAETVDSLENYPNGIKIYNKKGDLINEN